MVPSLTVESTDTGWWVSDSADGLFQPVSDESTLLLNQFVKYQPKRDDGFGVRRMSLSQDAGGWRLVIYWHGILSRLFMETIPTLRATTVIYSSYVKEFRSA